MYPQFLRFNLFVYIDDRILWIYQLFLCISIGSGEKYPDNEHIFLENSSSMDHVMVGTSEALGVVSQNTRSRLQTIFAIDFAGTILSSTRT